MLGCLNWLRDSHHIIPKYEKYEQYNWCTHWHVCMYSYACVCVCVMLLPRWRCWVQQLYGNVNIAVTIRKHRRQRQHTRTVFNCIENYKFANATHSCLFVQFHFFLFHYIYRVEYNNWWCSIQSFFHLSLLFEWFSFVTMELLLFVCTCLATNTHTNSAKWWIRFHCTIRMCVNLSTVSLAVIQTNEHFGGS